MARKIKLNPCDFDDPDFASAAYSAALAREAEFARIDFNRESVRFTYGDGRLAEFDKCIGLVRCGVAVFACYLDGLHPIRSPSLASMLLTKGRLRFVASRDEWVIIPPDWYDLPEPELIAKMVAATIFGSRVHAGGLIVP